MSHKFLSPAHAHAFAGAKRFLKEAVEQGDNEGIAIWEKFLAQLKVAVGHPSALYSSPTPQAALSEARISCSKASERAIRISDYVIAKGK